MEKAPDSKKTRLGRLLAGLLAALALLFCLLATFFPGGGIPSWRQIFSFFGVSDFTAAADGVPLSVHVLDVGKADCIYIEAGEHRLLIDAGDRAATPKVTEYLKRRGVERLDLVLATHPDKDHIGGMADVLRNFAVERFFMPELPEELIPTSRSYEEMLLALEETGVRVQRPSVGEVLTFGQASLHVLAPGTFFPESSNDNSVVCRLVFGEISFLFMGDAEEPAEEALLSSGQALASTVLKVGHHGSNTSTTQALLSAVQPRYAVISVGEDENNLPKNKVLKRLTANQIPFYRTDLNGTVLFLTDGKDLKIETER